MVSYPSCTEITGRVEVTGTSVVNLNGLANLRKVGALFIHDTGLQTLNGLSSLESVVLQFTIRNNDALVDLTGLDNVVRPSTLLTVEGNDNLLNLKGMTRL